MKNQSKISENLMSFLIAFLVDFLKYFRWMPKAPTLDPLENFRVIRGVRQLGPVRKSSKNALENEVKIIAISVQKSYKK